MKNILLKAAAASLLAASIAGSHAAVITLDFEGIGDGVPVGDFYNGVGGPDYNISFGPNALALEGGNYGNNPSQPGIMFFLEGSSVMNVPDGFQDGFSFFYSAYQDGGVNIWSGADATGTLLASFALPTTPSAAYVWFPIGVAFAGVAHSVDFVGAPDEIGFDNITFGSATPEGAEEPVPEPSTIIGGLALAGIVGRRALRRNKA